jgi:DNA repair protein RadA/Sms
MLSLCGALRDRKPLYVTGEESLDQIRFRAERLELTRREIAVLSEQCLENILAAIENYSPGLVIVDSIQTLYARDMETLPGSIGQVRYCAGQLVQVAKRSGIPIFLIGHVTKEGALAGPKVLEHMVDVVIQFEGEGNYAYRLLRATKNRYGSTNEIGVFEMRSKGLVAVPNSSAVFLTQRTQPEPGTAISALLEGSRALLVEIQTLVVPSGYGIAQRITTGYDAKRLQMLLAVLERRLHLDFAHTDVFLNVAGGLVVRDPGVDLAVCAALVSSLRGTPLSSDVITIGEVSLTGELHIVTGMDVRLNEAEKLGFRLAIVPTSSQGLYAKGVEITPVPNLSTAIEMLVK